MKRMAGRPNKAETKKFKRRNITLPPVCDNYVLEIIKQRNLSSKGWYARIVAEIIRDHENVKQFKEQQAAKLKAQLNILEK